MIYSHVDVLLVFAPIGIHIKGKAMSLQFKNFGISIETLQKKVKLSTKITYG